MGVEVEHRMSPASVLALKFALAMLLLDSALLVTAIAVYCVGYPDLLAAAVRSLEKVGALIGVAHVLLPLAWATERMLAAQATQQSADI